MSQPPAECVQLHTRLLKCTLEVDHARVYWERMASQPGPATARQAHEEFWFGARNLPRVAILLTNFRARFDAFPSALATLGLWSHMQAHTRRLLCHWHLQLSDPLYRRFTGAYLVERRARVPAEISHAPVVKWVSGQGAERWNMATRVQFASKLLTAARAAGLVGSTRDPRPLTLPRVDDLALGYLLYLLREVRFEGSLLANPYLASVGLEGHELERRLKMLPGARFRRQGDLIDFGWTYPDLTHWAEAQLGETHDEVPARGAGGAR